MERNVQIRIRIGGQQGDLVEEIEFLVRKRCVGRRLCPPNVPRQNLTAVEGGEIADQAAGDEP